MNEEYELVGTAQKRLVTDIYGSADELSKELASLSRQAAADGIVLMKNDAALPLKKDDNLAVFGRCAIDYFYVGNGSGGEVITPYTVNLMQGLDNLGVAYNKNLYALYDAWTKENPEKKAMEYEWGKWPKSYPDMPITDDIVKNAAATSNKAAIVIGRCAGEDRDSELEAGSFYLTEQELGLLDAVTSHFDKVIIIINSGNIIDFSWYEKYENKISAVLYAWQGGQESGNALADVLSGAVNPSGKMPVAVATRYEDYPTSSNFGAKDFNNYEEDIFVGYRYFETFAKKKVLFHFGYGLSYTNFEISQGVFKSTQSKAEFDIKIKNIGDTAGKTVVQYYFSAPNGKLGKAAIELLGFDKTEILQPNGETKKAFSFDISQMKAFDDSGVTGHKNAYVLEAGEYVIYAGLCPRSLMQVGSVNIENLQVVEQLEEIAAPEHEFNRIVAVLDKDGKITKELKPVPQRTVSLKERILKNLPKETKQTGDKGYKLQDVKDGKVSIQDFVAQLDIDDLEALTRGDFMMNSPLGTLGNAGVYGGITENLRNMGVSPVTTTDGPSGIRLRYICSLMPCGMNLASTWDTDLVTELMTLHGQELKMRGSNVLLAPGMNIIRDPLCGRNFEYFSEDPYLSGKMGAAVTIGVQKSGRSACPKHFACNNQEAHRIINDSRLSQRALREIYLRGFEICVKEAEPKNIMTSYNKINGVWGHYHYETCTHVLRNEWGYKGVVITDWWMRYAQDPNFADLYGDAYRVRAQVDVLMPGSITPRHTTGDGSLLASYEKADGITLGEIQRSAINTLNFVITQLG